MHAIGVMVDRLDGVMTHLLVEGPVNGRTNYISLPPTALACLWIDMLYFLPVIGKVIFLFPSISTWLQKGDCHDIVVVVV